MKLRMQKVNNVNPGNKRQDLPLIVAFLLRLF